MKIAKLFKVICCVALYSVFPVFASDADDPVQKFERFVLEAKNSTHDKTPVYLNQRKQAWAKRHFSVSDIKFDVKKTDSLVNPIVGLVTFKLITEQTNLYPTKEEAESTTVFNPEFSNTYRISMAYSYKDTKWSFSKGSYDNLRSGLTRSKVWEISEENFNNEPTAIPFAAILYWVPK